MTRSNAQVFCKRFNRIKKLFLLLSLRQAIERVVELSRASFRGSRPSESTIEGVSKAQVFLPDIIFGNNEFAQEAICYVKRKSHRSNLTLNAF